ncbi:MAG: prepilin-type N-terminal cleavage/methylation domain-containing protein [Actinomycetota bacterium]|nr:prepilin-type N-terminal cleavage/methylation domain-containing protein [Actinomycetota bacterium]
MRVFLKDERAFSLLEVMGALTIIAIILIPIYIMFYEGIRYVGMSKNQNQAASYGQERVEHIRNMTYTNITETNLPDETQTLGNMVFTNHVDVVSSPTEVEGADPNIKKIVVTVSWVENEATKTVSLATLRTKTLED